MAGAGLLRVAEAIRNSPLTPGSMLPTETELGADMKVNRPFYLAKCLIAARAGHLSVMQSLQS